ncbi:MAG: hypothetical protein IAB19_01035 [Proteobacteria bacterium]|uniref:HemY N-terminal domain-containing protein n=1 Tax=Candidatus Avisuccinivibrio stercorigallinarum TaxID=2840704 RepID=A0A9D9GMZ6_9GAMM|nr:hypothetical protein [Candidatus Avisuccinivibrio stercorigallinarum]
MLKILIFIIILCAAIFAGPYLADQQGYVHIATDNYIVETSLTTAVVLAIVSFIVLYFVVSLLLKILRMPRGTRSFFKRRGQKKTLNLQQDAVLAYEEEDYSRALALVKRSGRMENLPVESLFIGARAAFALQQYELCSKFLDEAKKRSKQSLISSSIIRAKLNLEIGNGKAALEVLDELKQTYSSKLITKLTLQCYNVEHDEDKIAKMTPLLVRQQLISKETAQEQARSGLIDNISKAKDSSELSTVISGMDKKAKQDPAVVGALTTRLLELGDASSARKYSLALLKNNLDPGFLGCVARWPISIPDVLSFLKKQAEDNKIASGVNVPLLKALGNLEFKSGQIKDAQEHLEKALELKQSGEIYYMLAQIMSAQRLYDKACEYYQSALERSKA